MHASSVVALLSRENERNCFRKVADGTGSRRASARMCDIERENVQNYGVPPAGSFGRNKNRFVSPVSGRSSGPVVQ